MRAGRRPRGASSKTGSPDRSVRRTSNALATRRGGDGSAARLAGEHVAADLLGVVHLAAAADHRDHAGQELVLGTGHDRRLPRPARVVSAGTTGERHRALRVRDGPQTLEPDSVSTGEGSRVSTACAVPSQNERETTHMHARARTDHGGAGRWRSAPRPPAPSAGVRRTESAGSGRGQDRRRRHPRLLGDVQGRARRSSPRKTGYTRQGRAQRRRRPAHQQAGAHQGLPDRRRGLRHRQHLRLPRRRRGRARPTTPRRTCRPPRRRTRSTTRREAAQLTPVDYGDVCVNVDDDVVRASTASPRRATLDDLTEAGVQGPVRHARRRHLLAGPGVPARHHREVRRRLAGVLEEADGQRRQGHRGLVGRLRGRLHRRRRAAATGRSCCPTPPRRRSRSRRARPKPTTSALLDTCFRQVEYAGVLDGRGEPGGRRRRSSTSWSSGTSRRRCPTTCTSSRSTPARRCPPTWAKYAKVAPTAVHRRPGRRSRRTATPGCASGATSPRR